MPKISKVRAASSRPGDAKPPKETLDKYCCTRCGKIYLRQKTNFPCSHSPLYKGNGGYLSICVHCVDDLFDSYKEALGNEKDAMRRICMKLDLYWSDDVYAMVGRPNTSNSRVRSYISKLNLLRFIDKTYDDTLDEEVAVVSSASDPIFTRAEEDEVSASAARAPDKKTVEFWGAGFTYDFYEDLEARYARWTRNVEMPIDEPTEALYKQICILEATINRNVAIGKPIEPSVNALNNLLGSANLKPSQRKQEDEQDVAFDSLPFGVGIKMCENTRPIPKPDPRFEDVDGIRKYISIWFDLETTFTERCSKNYLSNCWKILKLVALQRRHEIWSCATVAKAERSNGMAYG